MRSYNDIKTKIEDSFELLCNEFNLPIIPIKWTNTTRGKFRFNPYTMQAEEIRLGIKCWRGLENSMLHEFAHYLVTMQYKKNCRHGELFIDGLKEVTDVWFKDPKRYTWNNEYKHISKWAVNNGLSQKESE